MHQFADIKFRCYLALYSFLMRALSPLVRLKALRRGRREPGYLHAVHERFARYAREDLYTQNSPVHRFEPGAIWVHAVSLGETRAARVLIESLIKSLLESLSASPNKTPIDVSNLSTEKSLSQVPQLLAQSELLGSASSAASPFENLPRFLLTHSTATGRSAGQEIIEALVLAGLPPHHIHQVWYPWDTPGSVRRFLTRFKPRIGLLMETEVWPNMVEACKRGAVPLLLINARMSEKSFKSASVLGSFTQYVYRDLGAVFAQSPGDAEHLRRLGAAVEHVTGNIKFDAKVDNTQLQRGVLYGAQFGLQNKTPKPIILFASTREGEEALFFQAITANIDLQNEVQWLLVPRHPQRFDEVAKIGAQFGFPLARRCVQQSDVPLVELFELSSHVRSFARSDLPVVWLGDTLGEMALYYGMSSVALLGGSFERYGGQNLIEAAACACPLVMGAHVFNFSQAAERSLQRGAAVQVHSVAEGCVRARNIALDPIYRARMAQAATEFTNENKGAVSRTIDALAPYLTYWSN